MMEILPPCTMPVSELLTYQTVVMETQFFFLLETASMVVSASFHRDKFLPIQVQTFLNGLVKSLSLRKLKKKNCIFTAPTVDYRASRTSFIPLFARIQLSHRSPTFIFYLLLLALFQLRGKVRHTEIHCSFYKARWIKSKNQKTLDLHVKRC